MERAIDAFRRQGKLYDRSKQKKKILDAYHRLVSATPGKKEPEFILISGASGTGKTALAQTLRDPVSNDGGFFISGKFDLLQHPEPYAPLVAAFSELVTLILAQDGNDSVKEGITQAVSVGGSILTDMIPALLQLTNHTRDAASDKMRSSEYLNHVKAAFRLFARAVCSLENPVVFFLDDLQWADPSSLDLIYELIADPDRKAMAIVGSCRDNVPSDSYLSRKLRQMDTENVKIANVGVRDLKEEGVMELLSDILKLENDVETCRLLSQTVFRITQGNVLYVMEFLQHLATEELLSFDNERTSWNCELGAIQQVLLHAEKDHTVVDLCRERLLRLSPPHQNIMEIASCFGARFQETLIARASKFSADEVSDGLNIAVDAGLIQKDAKSGVCMFAHDNVQLAAYSMIPPAERTSFHLTLGRALWKRLSQVELEDHVFVVLNQLDKGFKLVTNQREKYGIASLCALAGRKAIQSSGFTVASEYLSNGIRLLGDAGWREEYKLSLSLYNSAAEVEFVAANFERMDELIDSVFLHGRCLRDKLPAYATQVYSLGSRNQKQLAIDKGLDVLCQLGESFPHKIHRLHVPMEAMKTKLMLREKSDGSLIRLPSMKDPDKMAAMKMLNLLFRNAYLSRPELVPLIVMRMVQITLRHGASAMTSVGFAEYGMMLCGVTGDVQEGFRFGELALSLLERFRATEWLPRVYSAMYGGINHWNRPISSSLEPLKYAHLVGLETGDIETSMLCINLYQYHSLHCGKSLPDLEMEVRSNYKLMSAYKQHSALAMLCPFWQMILNLMGKCEDPMILKGEAYDEDQGLKFAAEKNLQALALSIHYIKMVLAYTLGEYAVAEKMAHHCQHAKKQMIGSHTVALVDFFRGLTVLALAREPRGRRKRMSIARKLIQRTRRRALYSPETYLDQQFLLEAEYASICGLDEVAFSKYTCAISIAGEQGARLIYALANERTAMHMLNACNDERARLHLTKANSTYISIGASQKVKSLKSNILLAKYLS